MALTDEEVKVIRGQLKTLFDYQRESDKAFGKLDKEYFALDIKVQHLEEKHGEHKKTTKGHGEKIDKHADIITRGMIIFAIALFIAEKMGLFSKLFD